MSNDGAAKPNPFAVIMWLLQLIVGASILWAGNVLSRLDREVGVLNAKVESMQVQMQRLQNRDDDWERYKFRIDSTRPRQPQQ